ncbi:caspase family protein [Sulfurimonas sp. HSL3-7]|uniref:caspase family protein n=1 Tax=Sulfonitrofixus jiaomeiensis TaxID=3131938 RepID=UPI0031F72C91
MMRITLVLSILMLSLWAAPTLQTMKKEARVAIVVGNGNYDEHALTLPIQNARNVRKFLEQNGFYVYYGENLDKRNFIRLLRKFNKKMHPGGVALFYFSGHLVQTKRKNYLVPIDSGITEEAMIPRQGIAMTSVYTGMRRAHNRLNIIVLDGAKEAPFGSLFALEKESYAPIKAADDFSTFIATYPDRLNNSDTFTKDFLSLADKKGLELQELKRGLSYVRKQHNQPQPYITLTQKRPFYFKLPDRLPTQDEIAYAQIKNSQSRKEIANFINAYPQSVFVKEAEKQLKIFDDIEEKAREDKRKAFEAKAAEATRKMQEKARKLHNAETNTSEVKNSTYDMAEIVIEKPQNSTSEKPSVTTSEDVQKNDVNITLTKPGEQVKELLAKPVKGDERNIVLE